MGKLLANIVSACSPIRPPRALLGTLQKDSEVLLEITADFVQRRDKVRLISFYELEFTSIGPFIRKMVSVIFRPGNYAVILILCYRLLKSSRQFSISLKRSRFPNFPITATLSDSDHLKIAVFALCYAGSKTLLMNCNMNSPRKQNIVRTQICEYTELFFKKALRPYSST